MVKSKTVTCVVTGKTTTYAGDFLKKKLEEYGDENKLNKLYVCKEVKALLKKGYKVKDVRKILGVPVDEDEVPKDVVKLLESEYQKTAFKVNDTESQTLSTISTLTYDKSDPDVETFIKTFILKTND